MSPRFRVFLICVLFPCLSIAQSGPDDFAKDIFHLLQKYKFEKLEHRYIKKEDMIKITNEVFVDHPEKIDHLKLDRLLKDWNTKKEKYFSSFRKEFERLTKSSLGNAKLDSIAYAYNLISPAGESEIVWPESRSYALDGTTINGAEIHTYFHINKVNFTLKMHAVKYKQDWFFIPRGVELKSSAPGW